MFRTPVWLAASLVSVGRSQTTSVTPVEEVIQLLTNLKNQVVQEGKDEAGTYDAFACFCKSTTKTKSDNIISGRDTIGTLSASIEKETAEKEGKISEVGQREADHEAWTAELSSEQARCAKAQVEYTAQAADLTKAISSLDNAIQAMENSKPTTFLAVRKSVERSLVLAEALNLIAKQKRADIAAFLQVDPSDPGYKYHSQGIIDILVKLHKEFQAEKGELDSEWGKTKQVCEETETSLTGKISSNSNAISTLQGEIGTLKGTIAANRESLVTAESSLTDDQQYLKELTARCEVRATDWDQRSKMRSDELEALSGALTILEDKVQPADVAANNRSVLQLSAAPFVPHHLASKTAEISRHAVVSLLQEASISQATQAHVLALLRSEGQRLHSQVLSSIASRVAADPFLEVKGLIQKLIERLLAESTAEATKKGYCDTQLGKANEDRDFRRADVKKLSLEISELELLRDELTGENKLLKDEQTALAENLGNATELRKEERTENLKTIKTAKEGLEAVRQAIVILQVFYKKAARATVLLQASPVDEDTSGAGFSGAYKGSQVASKGIIGMLKVIESDFDRTVRHTEAAEKKAAEEFVEFDRVSRSDIEGKNTKRTLNGEDLITTTNNLKLKVSALKTAQGLLDDALKLLEVLKPTCIDTGMSYQDRVSKREEEIEALKRALCILDTDGVEAECQ